VSRRTEEAQYRSLGDYIDKRPVVVALAGPNGAGKTTFYRAHLRGYRLRFVNADILSDGLDVDPYRAAMLAARLRDALVEERESFVFETVFSDPKGEKLAFLKRAAASGYSVIVCFIGLRSARASKERVAMRVSQGGHAVPAEKLTARFPRTLTNLTAALRELPVVMVFDNSDLEAPFRHVATFENGSSRFLSSPLPRWLLGILPRGQSTLD
jgi:predicted ABC-type ATPase